MDRTAAGRARRAMTLTEIAVTMVVLAILAILAAVGTSGTVNDQGDLEARNLLSAMVAAQHIRHDTLGSFATSAADLDDLVGSVTVVQAASPSTSDDEVSMSVTVVGGEDVVVVAALARSGRCYAIRSTEPGSSVPDQRQVFTPTPGGCSASAATSVQTGRSW